MRVTACSTPNIAFIKYWGNRNDALRLPAADSLSMTLDGPMVEVVVEAAERFAIHSFREDGKERVMSESEIARFREHLRLTRNYLAAMGHEKALPATLSITIRSSVPLRVGIASSAAVFSAVAKAYAALVGDIVALANEHVSVMARLGSGSAARSVFGGFCALQAGVQDTIDAARAVQIADEHHWSLHDIIIVPSLEEKKVTSSEGHRSAHSSPFFADRLTAIRSGRQQESIDAILQKDFEKLRSVAEEDCLNMHHVMETSLPPLRYLNDETHRIVREIKHLRAREHIPVLFTMDAGPTVHLICPEEGRDAAQAFACAQKKCRVIEATVGSGAHLV